MWVRRVLWLFAIWSASVLALGVVALAMRELMSLAGLTGGLLECACHTVSTDRANGQNTTRIARHE
jgi:hypothetical protein